MEKNVSNEQAFWFCTDSSSTGFVAHNLEELKRGFRKAPMKSIKFHLRDDKNDFEAWLRNIMEEPKLADNMVSIKEKFLKGSLKGIALRKNLTKSIEVR